MCFEDKNYKAIFNLYYNLLLLTSVSFSVYACHVLMCLAYSRSLKYVQILPSVHTAFFKCFLQSQFIILSKLKIFFLNLCPLYRPLVIINKKSIRKNSIQSHRYNTRARFIYVTYNILYIFSFYNISFQHFHPRKTTC